MVDWFFATLRQYPEIAIFLTLALGYYFGKFTFKGIGLGSVTATLLAGVVIGQIGITIAQPLKATVFLMFLFAVGYAVGPQFVRGVAKDGLPQAFYSVVQCVLCLLVPVAIVKFVGYDVGYAAGLYSGSQTISAASPRRLAWSGPPAGAVTHAATTGNAMTATPVRPRMGSG
jgi:putative transport protein